MGKLNGKKWKMGNKPTYLIRPGDYAVYSINENGTYSNHKAKIEFPGYFHGGNTEEFLRSHGFFVGDEKLFDWYEEQGKAYYKKLEEESRERNDGHGDYDE